jgi:hypothetical protein
MISRQSKLTVADHPLPPANRDRGREHRLLLAVSQPSA